LVINIGQNIPGQNIPIGQNIPAHSIENTVKARISTRGAYLIF